MMNAYDKKFALNHQDELDRLENGDEAERLYAIARLERACYATGGLGLVTRKLVERIEKDDSEIVRAWAMRALFHEATEAWPSDPEDRARLIRTLESHAGGAGSLDFSAFVAGELVSVMRGSFDFGR